MIRPEGEASMAFNTVKTAARGIGAVLAVLGRRHISRRTVAVVALATTGSVALGWFGYWAALAICTLSFIFIDAVVLRFAGPPVGTVAGAP